MILQIIPIPIHTISHAEVSSGLDPIKVFATLFIMGGVFVIFSILIGALKAMNSCNSLPFYKRVMGNIDRSVGLWVLFAFGLLIMFLVGAVFLFAAIYVLL